MHAEALLSRDETARGRYMRIFDYLREQAPYLLELIDKNKREKVKKLISNVSGHIYSGILTDINWGHLRCNEI
jgi:hypothetical protein